mmetsp:Transcript_20681/g.71013  ORF Transcript_20681/g.71013 Transcript_20681/m.71013 type:complete len:339 (+) Transcript_20681:23-1039(+)
MNRMPIAYDEVGRSMKVVQPAVAYPGVTYVGADDSRVKVYTDLKEKDLAGRSDEFILEGENSIYNLVQHDRVPLVSVCVSEKRVDNMKALIDVLSKRDVPVYALKQQALDDMVGYNFHRGVLGCGRKLPSVSPEALLSRVLSESYKRGGRRRSTIVIGEKVNNLDNTGALFRNGAAFGVDAILFDSQSSDPYYRKSIRVSGGHALVTPFTRRGTISEVVQAAQAQGYVVVALVTPQTRPDLPPPIELAKWRRGHRPLRIAVLVGAEGPGLSDEAQVLADVRLTIPMYGSVDSVNVATAAAIALYELTAPVHATLALPTAAIVCGAAFACGAALAARRR